MQRIAQQSALGLCIAAGIGGLLLNVEAVLAQPGTPSAAAPAEAPPAPRHAYPHTPPRPPRAYRRRPARRRAHTAPAAPESPPPAPPASELRGSAACIAGISEGIPRGDAHTAAALVCQALRDTGADVSAEPVDPELATGRGSAYRVDIRPLGSLVFVQVIFESPIGTPVQSRSLQLNGIEEVSVAAPRVADSIVHGTPLEKTAKVTHAGRRGDARVSQEVRRDDVRIRRARLCASGQAPSVDTACSDGSTTKPSATRSGSICAWARPAPATATRAWSASRSARVTS